LTYCIFRLSDPFNKAIESLRGYRKRAIDNRGATNRRIKKDYSVDIAVLINFSSIFILKKIIKIRVN
jgi:hypothetical protein